MCIYLSYPALLFLLLGLLLLETSHTGVACIAGETGDALWGVLPIDQQLWTAKANRTAKMSSQSTQSDNTFMSPFLPLGVMSGLLRAPWMISWASVFLAFKISIVSFSSVSSESCRRKTTCLCWLRCRTSSLLLSVECRASKSFH